MSAYIRALLLVVNCPQNMYSQNSQWIIGRSMHLAKVRRHSSTPAQHGYDMWFITGDTHGKEKIEAACHSSVVDGRCEEAAKHGKGEDVGPCNREEVGTDARFGIAEGDAAGSAVSIDQA